LKALRGIASLTLWAALFALSSFSAPPSQASDASGAIEAAQQQFNAGNYAGAISTLQATASQNASSAAAAYWLGRSYYEIFDYDSAITQFEKAVSLDPRNSVYHQWLGRADGGKADRDRSFSLAKRVKKEFQQAVTLDPSNVSARRDLEEYCLDAPWIAGGSKSEALDQVNAIAALDPIQGHLARALYDREGLKKLDDAESEIRQVLSARPKTADPYFEAAGFFETQNNPSDIRAAVDLASQVAPNDPRLAFYRGVVGVIANVNLPAADEELKAYLASTPERSDWPSHAAARNWLGRLYEVQGKRTEAAEQYRSALRLDPKNKDARTRLEKLERSSP
jgi:tetratricopeptide (TPR) repeat protein